MAGGARVPHSGGVGVDGWREERVSLIQVGEEPVCVSSAQDLLLLLLLLCTYLQLKPATLLAAVEPPLC